MNFQPLIGLYLIAPLWTSMALYSSDPVLQFATAGDRVTLKCGLPSIGSCSSVNWTVSDFIWDTDEVVTAGKVTHLKENKYRLLTDCSLEIPQMERDDARLYTCESGALNSSVSLRFLDITEKESPAEGTIELHCSFSKSRGFDGCKNDLNIHITWTTEDDVPITGNRFRFENPSVCFSKLIITRKLTDHHRIWKCQITQNGEVKVSGSYRTTVRDGLEEVFTAVGESVSLRCRNTSSLRVGDRTEWTLNNKMLSDVLPENGQANVFHVNKDSSLVISKLTPLNAGDYQCMGSSEEQRVLHKIRVHTLDVAANTQQIGGNLSLICVLTCAEKCEENFNLTWSGSNQERWNGRLFNVNNTLINELLLPVWPVSSDAVTCSVYREGSKMASKSLSSVKSLQTPAWLGLLLGVLLCAAAGGVFIHWKRKRNKDLQAESGRRTRHLKLSLFDYVLNVITNVFSLSAADELSGISMNHVYDVVQDGEVQQPAQLKREVATTDDGFYNLLQPVN
ncbi:uncharacterized protein LOC122831405 isoform X2 [Gambusia affinis]|uniref:uncharacterized protein LOC122831405 isoform X2 n=1 Tax=Gambusia affinis TaxID=33528 RepID=UPI001CDB71C6|nr:uncharacterized protein LOC122831405 isoform X2 [Gambusia affinis]